MVGSLTSIDSLEGRVGASANFEMARRTGFPVKHNLARDENPPRVSANERQTSDARPLSQQVARPATAFCSSRIVGIPSEEAAMTAGALA
jgi:hypothetical protein